MEEYSMDPKEFLFYVHEIDLSDIKFDTELDEGLSKLNGKKYIFTNGTIRHAERILEAFGIRRHFEGLFDIVSSNYIPKPNPEPYKIFLKKFDINPQKSAMIEDMAKNLQPAFNLGIKTIWLVSKNDWAKEGANEEYVNFISKDIKTFLLS